MWGLGFRGLGFRVCGLGATSRCWASRCLGFGGFRGLGVGFRASGLSLQGSFAGCSLCFSMAAAV